MKQARPKQRGGKFAGQAYHQPQNAYSKRFGVTTRTIKTWWKQGLPCDDADAMGEFLSSRGRKSEAMAFSEDEPRESTAEKLTETLADQLAARRVNVLDDSFLDGEGLVPAMQRIARMEVALADKLLQEINKPGFNFREFNNRFGIWIGMLKTMGKIEKDAPGILEKNKNQIDVGEVQEGVTKLLLDIVGRLALIPIRCRQELAAMTDAQEIEDFVAREVSIALDPVRRCEWMPADQRPPVVEEPAVNDTPAPVCASGPSSVKPSRRRSSSAKR